MAVVKHPQGFFDRELDGVVAERKPEGRWHLAPNRELEETGRAEAWLRVTGLDGQSFPNFREAIATAYECFDEQDDLAFHGVWKQRVREALLSGDQRI